MLLRDYTTRALYCSPEEAEELADDLAAELDKEEGIPALLKELKKALNTSLATANWLESIGEHEHASLLRTNVVKEVQPQINFALRGILDARHALRILAGSVFEKQAADAIHNLYCAAVEVAHGKKTLSGFIKRCNAYNALLEHKIIKANNEGLASDGKGGWYELTYLNGAAYVNSLTLQRAAIPACERRAKLTIDAGCHEVPVALWQWINEAAKSGLVQGLPACSLGDVEELKQLYGRARVVHNVLGSAAISKSEKAKSKIYYDSNKHPYADHDSTLAQAYVHDENGTRVIAPFPKRPKIAIKGSKRRAPLAALEIVSGAGDAKER